MYLDYLRCGSNGGEGGEGTYKSNAKTIFILQKGRIRKQSKTTYRETINPIFIKLNAFKLKDLVHKLKTIQIIRKANQHQWPQGLQNKSHNLRGTCKFKKQRVCTNTNTQCVSVTGVSLWQSCEEDNRTCVYIRWTLINFNELHPPPFSTWSGYLLIFVQLAFVWRSMTEALLLSLAGPPGCGLRWVWPQLPESRPGVLLVSEEPHGRRTLGKHRARPSSTGRSHGVFFRSGPIDSSTANTPSPAWISPPTTPVSWPWGWSMGTSPSMTCRLWRTRRVSSAAGEEQPPSVISCLPLTWFMTDGSLYRTFVCAYLKFGWSERTLKNIIEGGQHHQFRVLIC